MTPTQDFRLVEEFIARLRVVRLVANIGDARSLVAHPASMTHSHLSATQLAEAGISSTTVRLSIGLESLSDILADFDAALAGALGPRPRDRRARDRRTAVAERASARRACTANLGA